MKRGSGFSIFRGLALGLTLSVLNLVGALLTVTALGGLGEWSVAQFIGLFGAVEVATGVAFVIGPNIWRLPVAVAKLPHQEVRFAASTILIPHWAGGVKSIGGGACLIYAAVAEGVGPATFSLPFVVLSVCAASVGLSMILARLGAMRPDLDVYGIVIQRPGKPEWRLPEISLGSSLVQFLLSICTFPAVKLIPVNALYQPELGPSLGSLSWSLAAGGGLLAVGFASWAGRLGWQAPRPQQREANQFVQGG